MDKNNKGNNKKIKTRSDKAEEDPSPVAVIPEENVQCETDLGSSITQEFFESQMFALRKELTELFREQKDEIIKSLRQENETLKTELRNVKQELSIKCKEIVEIEKDVIDLQQYVRRNNIEICGIPNDVGNASLEKKVIDIANAIDVEINVNDIEACHRLKDRNDGNGPKRTIVRFVNRKFCEKLHRNKKKLNDDGTKSKLCDLGINGKVYINNNLCPYNKMLWGKCKRLYENSLIDRFWVFNGSLYVAINEDDDGIKVDHLEKLRLRFPNFDFDSRI